MNSLYQCRAQKLGANKRGHKYNCSAHVDKNQEKTSRFAILFGFISQKFPGFRNYPAK
jgi:hypothetical protein